MYKNKNSDGTLNVSGKRIQTMRKQMQPKVSQKGLADMLQLVGLDIDKNAVQRIESGERFITDIELKAFAQIFNVSADALLGLNDIEE
ncbi:MAG: helix-turn-helix transcriptional regulator [Oscillospiraceae bacterium]|nr:helix-turn-helix transcriptional regulator [Oscillospiraceae bacterium]